MIVDLYAGPGGWSEALRALEIPGEIGLEWDAAACATRAAAGHPTVRTDIGTYPTAPFRGRVRGLIGSPPCPAFSAAGKGHGRDVLPEIVAAIHRQDWTARPDPDPEVWLVIDLGRWIVDLEPEWVALEQVPAVLPVWRAYAHLLEARGYSVWTGILNAANYGVPQTRRRAILIASRTRTVGPPPATHALRPTPTLFGDELRPWVTMADALGWGMTHRPAMTLAPGTKGGGPDIAGGAGARRSLLRERSEGRWIADPDIGRPEKPARTTEEPSRTITGESEWWRFRPSTTIYGDPRVAPPGHHDPNVSGSQFGEGTIQLEIWHALVLQSFRPDYPVSGQKTKQFQQVGNAVPPGLARAILEVVTK